MKNITLSLLVVAATLLTSSAFASRITSHSSCSGCKYTQIQPDLADEAAAFIASKGQTEISSELRKAMDAVNSSNATDLEKAQSVLDAARE